MSSSVPKLIKALLFSFVTSLAFTAPVMAESYDEGIDYQRVGNGSFDQDKIEVAEFFSYACPHCNKFEPLINEWQKEIPENATFVRIPVVFRPSWKNLAQAYYTAEILGVTDKVHHKIFEMIHGDKHNHSPSNADIKRIFLAQGVTPEDFDNTFNSFLVHNKVRRGMALSNQYGVNGVPTLVVGQTYRVDSQGSYEKMLKTTNYLLDKAF